MFKVHNWCARECKIPRQCWFLGQAWWDISGIFSQWRQQSVLLSAVALVWQHPPSAGWLTSLVTVPGDTGSTGSRGFSPTSVFFTTQFLLLLKQTSASLWCRGWSSAWQSLLIRNFSQGTSGSPLADWSSFHLCHWGASLSSRFRASLYPCPETPQERKEMASGVNTRIDDLQMVK